MPICCFHCGADPAGRWKQPPALIFIDPYRQAKPVYSCRADLTPQREAEIQAREKALGYPLR